MTLIEQARLDARGGDFARWQVASFEDVKARLEPPSEFPCLFSQTAFRRQNILFSFVADLSEGSIRKSADDLADYVERSKYWDGTLATSEPLLVIFDPETVTATSNRGYNDVGWWVLQRWHDLDTQPWPEDVAVDPHSPFWTMCFHGIQLFVNMSNPKHVRRRSRNLGDALTFVINPRERFDIVAGDNATGRQVRQRIRDRIETYDGQPHCPALGSYQAGDLEWPQYGLLEDNLPRGDSCPFRWRPRSGERTRDRVTE